ncbi:ATP-binding cassette domain-containing protein [Streptomyces californicus]|uniref:ATP-binding cassette domain-containing protein n=1 Tax=Streptomyces californicus TaxID=67351 RepID=A0ABD7CTH3_9ACTN|nr:MULTISPECIES: ABC transporter ATP-binding protein [Streptomyces]QRV30866.1 ATP-binding cassette domain-containing protein [Streptomyces californicus]QRV33525.1 ATP-binding cassette domain-containing protein [Streptomyces californicus]QRV44281.1 ATP-binding cassette domain-containing protein [Streptomyces californicus]QRV50970.1 ATP-binding cassette domain-containing protein [Streptomyces californicus]
MTTPPHTADEGAELLPVATAARTRAALRTLVRPDRGLALTGIGVLVAATVIGLLVQPLLGRIVDVVADGRPAGDLTLPVVLLIAVAAVQGVTTTLGLTRVARLGETVLARLREQFVERALNLPADRLERAGSGDLTARVTGDVARVTEAVRSALPEMARSVLAIGLTLGALALLDVRFLLAALLAVPVQLLTARWYVRRAVTLYADQRVANGAQQQQLLETIGGAVTVRGHRLEERHTERGADRSRKAVDLTMRSVNLVLGFYGRLHIAEYIGLAAVLIAGFWLVRDGAVSIGTATAAALYFHSLFGPVNAALVLLDDAQSAAAGLARLVGVTDLAEQPEPKPGKPEAAGRPEPGRLEPAGKPEPGRREPDGEPLPGEPEPAGKATPGKAAPASVPRQRVASPEAAVSVHAVSHAYGPGRPVLHEVSLTLAPGEHVALVGASGAGKSTLARIVAGVQQPTAGTVTGPTAGTVTAPAGPGGPSVVLVTQEVHVFTGTLADDLRLARPDATDDDLRAALATVDALDWAAALPDGLATVVGEGGHRLDAARAQQLALARLVLADPALAVLDEATAEAGSAGARALERSAGAALTGRTALVVAHRLTQAVAADRVVVLEAGRVVESGPHEMLRDADGPYAALWRAWSGSRAAPHP